MIHLPTTLSCLGHELDTSPDAFGQLASSRDLIDEPQAMRRRLDEDGYLYLPGYLDVDEVMAARRAVCEKLDAAGLLDDAYPIIEAVPKVATAETYMPDLAVDNPPLMRLLYSGRMIAFYERFLGAPVRHFDYTWFRTISPGHATPPHCDIVYMGRGTPRLFTSWTPIGDADLVHGGLLVMERSHRLETLKNHYGRKDVDVVCRNRRDANGRPRKQDPNFGQLTRNPVRLRENLDLRWLTADYSAGDLVVFSMYTIHTSLDNRGHRIRLSSDSRYQRADAPVDDRWISINGKPPTLHGDESRREMIC